MAKPEAEAGGEGTVRSCEVSLSVEDLHFVTAPPPTPRGCAGHPSTPRVSAHCVLCEVVEWLRKSARELSLFAPIMGEQEVPFSSSLKS